MKTWAHGLAALPLAGFCYWREGSALLAVWAAAASVLVDLDHLPDYLLWRRGWRGLGDFFASYHSHRVTNLYIVAHSWELLTLAWTLILVAGAPPWLWAPCLGWLYHLLWDQVSNGVDGWFYFLLHRARHGFSRARLRPPRPGEHA